MDNGKYKDYFLNIDEAEIDNDKTVPILLHGMNISTSIIVWVIICAWFNQHFCSIRIINGLCLVLKFISSCQKREQSA